MDSTPSSSAPPAGGVRTRPAATDTDVGDLVRQARRVADTTTAPRRGRVLYDVVRAFYDSVKFTAVTIPGEHDFLAPVGGAALGYRNKTSEMYRRINPG